MPERKWINLGLFSISIIPLILYLFVVSQRLTFPFDVEWAEGAAISQLNRILSGEHLYGRPTVNFSPLVYTPLYYYIAAAFSLLGISSLLSLRLVSLIASLGSAGLIGLMVSKETQSGLAGWLAGMLYIACFELSGGFYDLARVDSLYIFIILLTALVLRKAKNLAGFAAAGLLIAAAFFTKQSAIILFSPLLAFLSIKHWKKTWITAVLAAAAITGPIWVYNQVTAGWFSYYIFHLPSQHGYSFVDAVYFWTGDIFRPLGITVGFMGFYWISKFFVKKAITLDNSQRVIDGTEHVLNKQSQETECIPADLFYLLFAVGAFLAAWITRASNGGGPNNAMSAYAAAALIFGLGIQAVLEWIYRSRVEQKYIHSLVAGLVFVQFAGLLFNPFNYIPTVADKKINQKIIKLIMEADDNVLIPYRSHLLEMTSKESQIHIVGLFELTGYFHGEIQGDGLSIIEEIQHKICNQDYSAIILDQPIPWFDTEINAVYRSLDPINFPESEKQSEMMKWQLGYKNIYVPDTDQEINKQACGR